MVGRGIPAELHGRIRSPSGSQILFPRIGRRHPTLCKLKIVDVSTVFWCNIYFVVCLDCECEESGNFSHECLRTPFNLHVESNYGFCEAIPNWRGEKTVALQYGSDPAYTTLEAFHCDVVNTLRCTPATGPSVTLRPGETFESFRALYKQLADEAYAAGIALGGYLLTSSRSAGMPADNVQNPKPRFGRGPCLCSRWGHDYLDALASFMDEAGFGVLENDGPFSGDSCSATNHPYHAGEADSVWR